MSPTFVYANIAEAGLWSALAAVVSLRGRTPLRWWLALALLAFGVSDLVETRTGAWYRPWWLLAWKAACIVGIVALGTIEVRARRRSA